MDSEIHLSINKIKNILKCELALEFERGIYSIVGENASGKSTIMLMLSLLVKPSSIKALDDVDYESSSCVTINIGDKSDKWYHDGTEWTTGFKSNYRITAKNYYHGFYEGTIFYGSRFNDYMKIGNFIKRPDINSLVREADDFVKDTLSYILHGDQEHYRSLKKIKNKALALRLGLRGIPYFIDKGGKLISQYSMSSGESMLISLIDFINNLVLREHHKRGEKIVFLIDEVEIALHPSAVDRLIDLFNKLANNDNYNLVVYFSTHSSEVIQKIKPKCIYLIENINGEIKSVNPCYPNYAVRNLYVPNGFDFLVFVEDDLSKALVDKVVRDSNLCSSKLCCVLPSGGWAHTLKLHNDIVTYNVLGVGKRIVSILDSDIEDDATAKKEYQYLPKLFLPVKSIEKYLLKKLVFEKDRKFTKLIGDKYFNQRSLPDIIKDYLTDPRSANDSNGKGFYKVISANLYRNGIGEEQFVRYLCDDIYNYEDLSKFISDLKRILS